MSWRWLGQRVIEAIHQRQLQRHGGGHGLRDRHLLESALARPQNLPAYGEPTAFELAASYAFGVARNHPFVDGNKRTAFVSAALFMRANGYRLTADKAEAAIVFFRFAAGELSEEELADWLRRNAAKDKRS